MIPPAVPAYCPAMSSGSVQSTALVNSRKKNPAASKYTAPSALPVTMAGRMNANAPPRPTTSSVRRARRSLPVRRKIVSEITPPSVSPTTPPSSGSVVMSAIRSSLNPRASDRYDGSHVRNTHSDHP